MINFLVHWSIYLIIFSGKLRQQNASEALCMEIIFPLSFYMNVDVAKARIVGTQYFAPQNYLHSVPLFLPVFIFKEEF